MLTPSVFGCLLNNLAYVHNQLTVKLTDLLVLQRDDMKDHTKLEHL